MKRVLVVDDELGALALIGIMLDRGKFLVSKAQNATEAMALLDSEPPDLIILDIMMPGVDGIELCRQIRALGEKGQMPILILSARGDSQAVISSLDAGATDYLQKPIFHHNLVSKVREMLNITA